MSTKLITSALAALLVALGATGIVLAKPGHRHHPARPTVVTPPAPVGSVPFAVRNETVPA